MGSRVRRALAATPTRRFAYLGEAPNEGIVVLDRHTRVEHRVPLLHVVRGMSRLKFNSEAEACRDFSKACWKLLVPRG